MDIISESLKFISQRHISHIPLSEIIFSIEPNHEIENLYYDVILKRIIARYQGIIVGRILYTFDFVNAKSQLLMLHTLNDTKHFVGIFEKDEFISHGIIERGLGEKFFKNYLEDCQKYDLKECHFLAQETSIGFYEKMIAKFQNEGMIKEFEKGEKDFRIQLF